MWPFDRRPRSRPATARLDPDATRVLDTATRIAEHDGYEFIGTEHLLLALLGDEPLAGMCRRLRIDPSEVRADVRRLLQPPWRPSSSPPITLTPRAKSAVELAVSEAARAGGETAAPAHLLLGLLAEVEGVAAQILFNHGATAEAVRTVIEAGDD